MKKIGILSAHAILMDQIHKAVAERFPGVTLIEICDTGLSFDEMNNGEIQRVTDRIAEHAVYCEKHDCRGMLVTFAAFYNSILAARKKVSIPVFAIQEPMIHEAVHAGNKLAIVRSHGGENDPTIELLRQTARDYNINQQIDLFMADGAFAAKLAGREEDYKHMVLNTAHEAAKGHDALVLMHASLQPFVALLDGLGIPILNSVVSGIEQMSGCLED
jgi:Asp/Glu/hydantoin racemase